MDIVCGLCKSIMRYGIHLREFCVPQHLIWLKQKLYSKATGVLRIAGEHTDQFPFEKGVRQGCVLSASVEKLSCVC